MCLMRWRRARAPTMLHQVAALPVEAASTFGVYP